MFLIRKKKILKTVSRRVLLGILTLQLFSLISNNYNKEASDSSLTFGEQTRVQATVPPADCSSERSENEEECATESAYVDDFAFIEHIATSSLHSEETLYELHFKQVATLGTFILHHQLQI